MFKEPNWTSIYDTEYLTVQYDVLDAKEMDQKEWTLENHLAVKNFVCTLAAVVKDCYLKNVKNGNLVMALSITGLEYESECRKWAVDHWNDRLNSGLTKDIKPHVLECVKPEIAAKIIADINDISKRAK